MKNNPFYSVGFLLVGFLSFFVIQGCGGHCNDSGFFVPELLTAETKEALSEGDYVVRYTFEYESWKAGCECKLKVGADKESIGDCKTVDDKTERKCSLVVESGKVLKMGEVLFNTSFKSADVEILRGEEKVVSRKGLEVKLKKSDHPSYKNQCEGGQEQRGRVLL